MINKKFIFLLCLVACEEGDKEDSIFTSKELYSYESEQHTQVFDPKVNTNNKLDILLVIDNSGSMEQHQNNLAGKIEPLLSYINDTDWQIAITSSDTRDETVKIISKKRGNQSEFEPTITGLGTKGIIHEAIIWKAIQALKGNHLKNDLGIEYTQFWDCKEKDPRCDIYDPPEINRCQKFENEPYWLRADSMLAILLVTDEDHQCHDLVYGCTINDFYFYLKSIREPGATAKVYGLLGNGQDDLANGFVGKNKWFAEWKDEDKEGLFEYVASIRDRDYSKILEAISKNIAKSIESNFTLEHVYDDKGETSVTFIYSDGRREKLTKGQYRITGNTLKVIRKPPDNIKKIEVSYTYGK